MDGSNLSTNRIYTRPYDPLDETYRIAGRGTWQAAPRHKLTLGAELQKITEHRQRGFNDPAAAEYYHFI